MVEINKAVSVEGWMSVPELEWLAEQASRRSKIAEVGSHLGRSTRALADNLASVIPADETPRTILAVDDWFGPRDAAIKHEERLQCFSKFQKNLEDRPSVIPWKVDHSKVTVEDMPVKGPFDMVFIDGDHRYEAVKHDIAFWLKLVKPGGLICGHDYDIGYPGVVRAVNEAVGEPGIVPYTSIWWYEVTDVLPEPKNQEGNGVQIEQLKGKSLMVSTPCYNCQMSSNYVMSLLALTGLCRAYNVPMTVNFLHDSLVTRVRNRHADIFLASQCTHHMLIDSDIEFNAADVLKLLALDKEFTAAPYPKKQINWKRIKKICEAHPEIEPARLDRLFGDFVINVVAKDGVKPEMQLAALNEVTDAGTGFMLVKRTVYEKLIATGRAKPYTPMNDEPAFSGPMIYDFFRADIDEETNNYLSEDYWFCRQWKQIGGEVWMAGWVQLTHWGTYAFKGDLLGIAETGVGL